jgi:hypothetical protein
MHMRRSIVTVGLVLALGTTAPVADAHIIEGNTTLTTEQAIPPPSSVPKGATGTFVWEVGTDFTLEYTLTVQNLSGEALAAHLHRAPAGQANPAPEINLTKVNGTTFAGESEPLTQEQVTTLVAGGFYVNVHTAANPAGEIRGQITDGEINRGTCSCRTLSRKDFRRCVNGEIKKLAKEGRRAPEVKALKKAVKASACGLTKAPKKKPLACCLPFNEAAGTAVSGRLCAPVKSDAVCTRLGGDLVEGGSCLPTNPCFTPASPSGAFLD